MEDKKLLMKKWAIALNEFAKGINTDFMKDPAAVLRRVGSGGGLQKEYTAYLADCGVPEFLGESDVRRYRLYTKAFLRRPEEMGTAADIEYRHWNTDTGGVIKQCILLASPDGARALGMAVRISDGAGGFDLLFLGRAREDVWEIKRKEWEEIERQSPLEGGALISYTLLGLLKDEGQMPDAKSFRYERIR